MIERAPFPITPKEALEAPHEALDGLASFDQELKEHLHNHIDRGDFFLLLATYLGFLEETAADPDTISKEQRDQQVKLTRSIRKSLRDLATTHHILQNAA